jgi:hypothetical protein
MSNTETSRATNAPSRRQFLFAAGVTTVGGAAAVVATQLQQAAPNVAIAQVAGSSKGYHATEHVQDYYATARI